jgi:hypothetical protein
MKKTRFRRNAASQKPGVLPPTAGFTEPTGDDEELEAIRAYDSAKEEGGTLIPYERVLERIKASRQ